MYSLNQVNIIGNVGRDPELKEFDGGGVICNFSVATSRSWKGRDSDEWQEATTWHNVSLFGDAARRAAERLKKGSLVSVVGSYESRKYTNKNGEERTVYEVRAFKVGSLDRPPKGESSSYSGPNDEDDVPF